MDELLADRPLVLVLAGVLGAVVGSFLNVVIYRLPRGESIVRPPSRCPRCERRIRPWENVPVLSFALLGGRCRGCRSRISWRYPIVETLSAGLFVALTAWFGPSPGLLFRFFFAAALVAIAWIDLEFRIVPDELSLGGLLVGLFGSLFLPPTLLRAIAGALAGGGLLWLLAVGYRKATGIDGMGGGDIKLAAMIGAFLGPEGVMFTLLLAAFVGSLVGVALILLRRAGRRTALPFGTFLAPSAIAALFFAPAVLSWYTTAFLAPAR